MLLAGASRKDFCCHWEEATCCGNGHCCPADSACIPAGSSFNCTVSYFCSASALQGNNLDPFGNTIIFPAMRAPELAPLLPRLVRSSLRGQWITQVKASSTSGYVVRVSFGVFAVRVKTKRFCFCSHAEDGQWAGMSLWKFSSGRSASLVYDAHQCACSIFVCISVVKLKLLIGDKTRCSYVSLCHSRLVEN